MEMFFTKSDSLWSGGHSQGWACKQASSHVPGRGRGEGANVFSQGSREEV